MKELVCLKFEVEEYLPGISGGTLQQISIGLEQEVREEEINFIVEGKILITREFTFQNRTTKVNDCLPIYITIAKRNIVNKKTEVLLNLTGFSFNMDEKDTKLILEFNLSNVKKSPIDYQQELLDVP